MSKEGEETPPTIRTADQLLEPLYKGLDALEALDGGDMPEEVALGRLEEVLSALGGGISTGVLFPEGRDTAERVSTTVGREGQPSIEFLNDKVFVTKIAARLGDLVKVHEIGKETLDRISERERIVVPLLNNVMRAIKRKVDSHTCVSRSAAETLQYGVNRFYDLTESSVERGLILEILELLGAFDEGELQLNDICGGEGLPAFVAGILREDLVKGKTFGSCYEIEDKGRQVFTFLKNILDSNRSKFKFNKGDAGQAVFHKRAGARNIWIIKYPDKMTLPLLERIAGLSESGIPDAIGIVPCMCHSYNAEAKPALEESLISQEEWNNLKKIMDKYYDTERAASNEGVLLIQTIEVMDMLRAHYINTTNPLLNAEIHRLKKERIGTTVIKPKQA